MISRKFEMASMNYSVADALIRDDGLTANRYWPPLNQISWELYKLLGESGFIEALPSQIQQITILSCYGDAYCFDPSESHFEGKKIFKVYVHLDARDYWRSPPDEERYWPTLMVRLESLIDVAVRFQMPTAVIDSLRDARDRMPKSPPWPSLPPFDIRWLERYYEEMEAKAKPDSKERPRTVRSLENQEGILWVMCGAIPDGLDSSIDRLHGDLRELVAEKKLGEWEGDSRNGLTSDISFRVKSLARAAKSIDQFLRKKWPSLDFVIGDEYDPDAFEASR